MKIRLLYFASLADQAGSAEETRETASRDPHTLYAEVARDHGFALASDRVRVAVNGALVGWHHALSDGDEVVFLPPVSGG